jgi:thiol-disulfide isomerase/thioredoxin
MNTQRLVRHRLVTWLAPIVIGVLATSLVVAPAFAATARIERSRHVKVSGKALPTSNDVGASNDPAIGMTAPTITGQGFDGSTVTFAGDGKPRVVLFLAHWCPHCQAEVPRIVKLAKKGKLAGVEVQAVATNTDKSFPNYPPSKWLKREHWPFTPVMADDSKARALAAFGGDGFPFFVVIGANGKVAARASGEIAPSDIVKVFKRLVAGTSLFG